MKGLNKSNIQSAKEEIIMKIMKMVLKSVFMRLMNDMYDNNRWYYDNRW